jgi:hypothetical protein
MGPRRVLAQAATPESAVHHSVSKSVSQTDGYRPVQPLICHPAPYVPGAGASGEAGLANLEC